jgi:uncharacterized protein YkwD
MRVLLVLALGAVVLGFGCSSSSPSYFEETPTQTITPTRAAPFIPVGHRNPPQNNPVTVQQAAQTQLPAVPPPAAAPSSNLPTYQSYAWDIARLDTARDIPYLSRAEKDVILEMNKVRTNPRQYAEQYIRPLLGYYNGSFYMPPNKGFSIQTSEGKRAVEECYNVLLTMQSVQILSPAEGLSFAARDLVIDQGHTGLVGHTESGGTTFDVRILRYGNGAIFGENIAYLPQSTGQEIVVGLLVDDGALDRGHRINIMHRDYNCAGVSIGPHQGYGIVCVIDFGQNYTTTSTSRQSYQNMAYPNMYYYPNTYQYPNGK